METITTIILVIFGTLQVILFFKIWGATNDLKYLRNNSTPNELDKVERAYIAGNKEAATIFLKDSFLKELMPYAKLDPKVFNAYEKMYPQIKEKYADICIKFGLSLEMDKYEDREKVLKENNNQ